MPSKFLNISTDTTLGGSSASDSTVSSQKAIKAYVDSQTGTAPAFANITGQPTDNANLAAALDKKENIPYISLYNGSSGNPRPIKFLTVDYTNANSENGVFIKITMQSSHGNGVSYAFLQDAFFNVNYTGTISCEVFKYFGATTSYDGSRQYGDIFWVHDSENKIVDFYTLMGQFSALYSTPYRRLNLSTGGEIIQLTTASTYSEGTQVWASCGDYYTTADPVLTNLTTNATSLTIKGTPISPACGNSINIGYSSSVSDNGEVCVGVGASTRQIASTAIGFYASATKTNAIQLGTGTNSTANTFNVGFRNVNNYQLLDGTTGIIPYQRINAVTDNNNGEQIKVWTGTKNQYDAITTKDSATLYNITDDTTITQTILEALYPVGSVYITTANTCPLSTLINGSTWELVSSGRVLQGADSSHSAGTTIEAGLPNITGEIKSIFITVKRDNSDSSGAFRTYDTSNSGYYGSTAAAQDWGYGISFDASNSNSIYGNSTTVQPPAYCVNIYRRTA